VRSQPNGISARSSALEAEASRYTQEAQCVPSECDVRRHLLPVAKAAIGILQIHQLVVGLLQSQPRRLVPKWRDRTLSLIYVCWARSQAPSGECSRFHSHVEFKLLATGISRDFRRGWNFG
jgi:hypothetical protein